VALGSALRSRRPSRSTDRVVLLSTTTAEPLSLATPTKLRKPLVPAEELGPSLTGAPAVGVRHAGQGHQDRQRLDR
jgi:hypothetical protein